MDAPVRERRSWFSFLRRRKPKPTEEPAPQPEETVQPSSVDEQRGPPPAVGIDLGTTTTAVCFINRGEAAIIQNDEGNETTPSVVHFGDDDEPLVGEEAVKARRDSEMNTIFNIKRVIGRQHDDICIRQQQWPFEIVKGANGRAAVRVDDELHTPEQISAIILQCMRKIAKDELFAKPTDAVITVPANFSNAQREATKEAGRLAGLTVLQIVNEPTAAALAFSVLNVNNGGKRRLLVFDLGGGTFDVSLVEIEGRQTRVLATGGDPNLGGSDFDKRIYDQAVTSYMMMSINIPLGKVDWTLMEACETAKKALSKRTSTRISHPHYGGQGFDIRRDMFNDLCADLFEKTLTITDMVVSEAPIDEDSIDEILLVGGSTRIPRIREMIKERFPTKTIRDDIVPELAVAKGAAILAESLSKRPSAPEAPAASRTLSSSSEDSSSTSSTSSCESTSGESFAFVTLLDVAPFNLGLRIAGDRFKVLIPKNTPIPFITYLNLSNALDGDTKLEIEILEGNDPQASKNETLAKIEIEIPPKPAGKNNVKVVLSIDASGILSVSALDMHTNKQVSVTFRSDRVDELVTERVQPSRHHELEQMREQLREIMRTRLRAELREELGEDFGGPGGDLFCDMLLRELERRLRED